MIRSLLLDEHWGDVLLHRLRSTGAFASVLRVGLGNTPPFGTPDGDLLRWCAYENYVLITRDQSTMPVHLAEVIAEGLVVPGIVMVTRPFVGAREWEDLLLILLAGEAEELQNMIRFVPL